VVHPEGKIIHHLHRVQKIEFIAYSVISLSPFSTVTKTHTASDVGYGGTANSCLQWNGNCTGESIDVCLMFSGELVVGPPFDGFTCDYCCWLPTVKFVM